MQADDPDTPSPPGRPRPPEDPRPHDDPGAQGNPRPHDVQLPLPPAPADRDAIHLAHQARVERAYAEASDNASASGKAGDTDPDAWSQALPGLRASWQEHEARYPVHDRPGPQDHQDGSWSCGDGRMLTPDQNREVTKACADIHDEGDRVILPAMRRIEAADPDRHLAGLEHMLKGPDRIKEKVAEQLRYHPELAPRQAAAEVPDAVRFTLEYSEEHYTDGVLADVERLKETGSELLKLKNLWTRDQYKGINSQWRRPETGLRFEVQFHTPESREAKELTHRAYERLRDPHTSKAEEGELEGYQRQVNALIKHPPEIFRIEDYPPERHYG